MRNAANKWQIQLILAQKIIFCHSEQSGSLCGSHSGSLWLSLAKKALARLATSQLHRSSLSHSGTDMWISRPVPSRYPKFLSLPDPIPSRSKKPLPVSLCLLWRSGEKRQWCSEEKRSEKRVRRHMRAAHSPTLHLILLHNQFYIFQWQKSLNQNN